MHQNKGNKLTNQMCINKFQNIKKFSKHKIYKMKTQTDTLLLPQPAVVHK
jgi:hypothetical protein